MDRISDKELKELIGEKITPEILKIETPIGNKKITILVNKMIPFENMVALINSVVEQSFSEDIYKPYLHRISYVRNMLAYFTNLPYDCDNETLNYIMYQSKIFSSIEERISPRQLYDIRNMIEKGINFNKEMVLSNQRKLLSIAIDNLNREQEDITMQITTLVEKFNGMDFDIDKLEQVLDKAKEISQENLSANIVSLKEANSND